MKPSIFIFTTQSCAQDVKQAVRKDRDKHTRVGPTKDFVKTLLPHLPNFDWERVLGKLKERGWYCPGTPSIWKSMPANPKDNEAGYYVPVANIANAIIHLFFQGEEDIKKHFFPYFDPYFEPLQDLVLDWFRLLHHAFKPSDS